MYSKESREIRLLCAKPVRKQNFLLPWKLKQNQNPFPTTMEGWDFEISSGRKIPRKKKIDSEP